MLAEDILVCVLSQMCFFLFAIDKKGGMYCINVTQKVKNKQ